MLCGPLAAARATGIDYRTIAERISAQRERKGECGSLRGGTSRTELQEALKSLGWRMRPVFKNRRVPLKRLVQRVTKGRWIFQQSHHFFGVRSGSDLREQKRRCPKARMITHGWLVTKNGKH